MADSTVLMQRALDELRELRAKVATLERARREPIAIVGIGCRFPGGSDTPETYWRLLRDGVSAVGPIPEDRWDVQAYYDPDPGAPGKMYIREGGFLSRVDEFDPLFFGVSPREAAWLDPQQRLFLEVCWEALEHAGYAPDSLAGEKTGVFAGISSFNYATHILSCFEPGELDNFFGTGNALSVVAGRIAYTLGLNGPALAVDTACSSSLVAVHLACESLRRGECDTALAGGVGLILTPETTIGFCKAGMLARDGRCKTFDASADGYVRGEGAGVIVLKRLADAVAAKDNVIACIRGSACNHDGRSTGLTVPNGRAQRSVIQEALHNGGVQASEVAYIEAHGTGTSLGDPIELNALAAVFHKRDPLLIGSAKTNLGHLEAAAGIAGVIKVALSMQYGMVPPHLHFSHPTPLFNWESHPLRVATEATLWPENLPCAGVSSFGFSGTNAHVVMERAVKSRDVEAATDRPVHLFTLSAKSEAALTELVDRHVLSLDTKHALADRCFTANTGRAYFSHRIAATVSSEEELRAALSSGSMERGKSDGEPRVAFLFTGQGSQYPGMGRELYETHAEFRRTMQRCDAILRDEFQVPLLEMLYGAPESGARLHQTAFTQPSLFALEYALARLWISWGVEPTVVMGHSLGEYVAACVAGVFDLEAGLRLAATRGQMMATLRRDGEMIAVLASYERLAPLVERYRSDMSVASFNGPNNTVLSGGRDSIRAVAAELSSKGIEHRGLQVSHAFHSPLMEPMLRDFGEVVARMEMRAPSTTLISNLTGKALPVDVPPSPDYWCRHLRQPVRFADGVRSMETEGIDAFIEIGPSPTLLGMARQCLRESNARFLPSLRAQQSDWRTILASLGQVYVSGAKVNWAAFDRGYPRRRVELPTYPFQRQRCWVGGGSRKREAARIDEYLYRVEWRAVAPVAASIPPIAWRVEGADAELASSLRSEFPNPEAATQGVVYVGTAERSAEDHCAALVDVVRRTGAGRLWIVTAGTLASAPLRGLGRVIALEYPELQVGTADLDPDLPPAAQVGALAGVLRGSAGNEREVALRGDGILVPRLQRGTGEARRQIVIRSEATYLITGGLGGLGLLLAQSLVQLGARSLVLTGRSGGSSQAAPAIEKMRAEGVRIVVEKADVANSGEMAAVMGRIAESGRLLAGVAHAAGVLDDGIFSSMSRERFAAVLRPKVTGAWVLHTLTEQLPLDFFILCSSAASLLGSPGQSNYAAANAYLDALAGYRQERDLPALSVNWGPWSGVGMSARQLRRTPGVEPLPASLCTEVFERCLNHPEPQLLVLNANWSVLAQQFLPSPPPILGDLIERSTALPSQSAALVRLRGMNPEQRREWLLEYVQEKIGEVMRFPAMDAVSPRQGLFDMGMDSLLAMELRNKLQADLALPLPATTTFEHSSAMALAIFLEAMLADSSDQPTVAEDDELDALIAAELESLEGVLRR